MEAEGQGASDGGMVAGRQRRRATERDGRREGRRGGYVIKSDDY